MRSYGHINFNSNQAQQMALEVETEFPTVPVVGRILFKDKRVFICAEIVDNIPAWIPLTNEINTYVHRVAIGDASATWTIPHNLDTPYPIIQIYDTNHSVVIPGNIITLDHNTSQVTFGWPVAGTAVAMFSNAVGTARMNPAVTFTQTNASSTWVINHDLGYYPVVRVFVGNQEILPATIVHTTLYTVTLTFDTPQIGIATLV